MPVSIYTRLKDQHGHWRYQRIEEGRGKRTGDLSGPFYARPTVRSGGKVRQIWKPLLATTFVDAREEADHLEVVLEAQERGLTVAEYDAMVNVNRVPIKIAVETYLEQKQGKAKKTVAQYRNTLNEFIESLAGKIRFLDEITEGVLRKYKQFMEAKGHAGKTIDTRLNILYFLLKKNKIQVRLPKDEMPVVEEEIPVPYSDDDLKKLFAAMEKTEIVKDRTYSGVGFGEAVRYKFFLGTGCRDQEVTYAAWPDIDFTNKTYTVRRKEDAGFTPKSHESRTIPLPTSLVELLKARRKSAPHERWIFVNEEGRPDNHFLRKLKRIALHAGLNCGHCKTTITKGEYDKKRKVEVTCKTDPVCEHIYLHRLRKTCASRWEQNAVPVRTIQHWLGHKDLETTMIYLGVTGAEKLRTNIDQAFGD